MLVVSPKMEQSKKNYDFYFVFNPFFWELNKRPSYISSFYYQMTFLGIYLARWSSHSFLVNGPSARCDLSFFPNYFLTDSDYRIFLPAFFFHSRTNIFKRIGKGNTGSVLVCQIVLFAISGKPGERRVAIHEHFIGKDRKIFAYFSDRQKVPPSLKFAC